MSSGVQSLVGADHADDEHRGCFADRKNNQGAIDEGTERVATPHDGLGRCLRGRRRDSGPD
jgi:hypothetical protein